MSHNQLPMFSPGDLYTYFQQLWDEGGNTGLGRVKRAIYRNAHTYLFTSAFSKLSEESGMETINNALTFLGGVADSERNKEVRLIATYIDRIYNKLPPAIKKGQTVQDLVARLKLMSDQLSSKNTLNPQLLKGTLDAFYTELSTYINLTKTSYEELKARVQQIADNNKKTFEDLSERSYLFRAPSDVDSALTDLAGAMTRTVEDSFSRQLRETVFDFMDTSGLIKNTAVQDSFETILAAIIVDFENYLQKVASKNNEQIFDNTTVRTTIDKQFNDYLTQQDSYFSEELRRLLQSGVMSEELTNALTDFKEATGISEFDAASEEFKKRKRALERQAKKPRSAKKGEKNYISKRLKELGLNAIVDRNQYVHISGSTNQRHGKFFEGITAIIKGAISGSGGAATDVIELGNIYFTIQDDKIRNDIDTIMRQIMNEIKSTQSKVREDRFTDIRQELIRANESIEKLGKDLRTVQIPTLSKENDDIFVYHDSLKLYATMEETQDGKRRATSFHGRDMNVLNALDNLYTIDSEVGGPVDLLDKTALYGAILNLSNLAVGAGQKGIIENYLSIFVGLLMFSDIRNIANDMAKEATLQLTGNADTTHIHLYLLNDTYVPGSMVLSYLYNGMKNLAADINPKQVAKATIDVSGADAVISTYQAARANGVPYSPDDWGMVANAVANATKIRISFLGTFLQFINNLQNFLK